MGALRGAKNSIRSKLRVPKLRHATIPIVSEPVRDKTMRNQTTVTMMIEDPDEPKPIRISIQGPPQLVKGMMEGGGEFSVGGRPHEKKPATRRKRR